MTYKEFEKWLKNEMPNLSSSKNKRDFNVLWGCSAVASVSTEQRYVIHTVCYEDWHQLTNKEKEKLFNKLVELARTPLEDREEKKEYYVRIPFGTPSGNTTELYLVKNTDCSIVFFDTKRHELIFNLKYKFTENEIKAIDERLWAFAEEVE